MQNTSFRLLILSTLILLTVMVGKVAGQSFDEARNLAFNGQREKAREMCREILKQGFNADVALLMGRTYSWDGIYDSARIVIDQVLTYNPEYLDALSARADVEYWSENHTEAVLFCDKGIQIDSTAENLILKKARILHSSERYLESVEVLQDYLKKNPGNNDFIVKLKEYRPDLMKNKIRLNY